MPKRRGIGPPSLCATLALGVLLFNDRVITAVIHLLMGVPQLAWAYWLAPLLGMLLWPPLHLLLDTARLRRRS